jgi:glycosyltransferase involved in cell wall biosynthesis
MVGPDKRDGSMQQTMALAVKLGVRNSIYFPGHVPKDDVPKWLEKADIFLNTTNVDNAPISVLEALACGLCIVSTNVGGIPYLLRDGHDALLAPVNDAPALFGCILKFLKEPGLGRTLSINARVKAEAHDWTKVIIQWEHLFRQLAKSPVT